MFDQEVAKKDVEVRILVAGVVLIPLLLLWEKYIDEIRTLRAAWQQRLMEQLQEELTKQGIYGYVTAQPLSVQDYFSIYGLKTLIPHDLILLAFAVAIILSIITVTMLARALLAVEEKDEKRVEQLTDQGMRYFGWVLDFLIFFIIINWIEESLFPFGTIFQENMWIMIGIAIAIAVVVRMSLNKKIGKMLHYPGLRTGAHSTTNASSPTSQDAERFCVGCGQKVSENGKFCPKCGSAQK